MIASVWSFCMSTDGCDLAASECTEAPVLPKGVGDIESLDRLRAGKGVGACTSRTKLGSALP